MIDKNKGCFKWKYCQKNKPSLTCYEPIDLKCIVITVPNSINCTMCQRQHWQKVIYDYPWSLVTSVEFFFNEDHISKIILCQTSHISCDRGVDKMISTGY